MSIRDDRFNLIARLSGRRSKLSNIALLIELFFVYLFLWGPTLLVVYIAFGRSGRTYLPVEEFSLHWFWMLIRDERLMTALVNSIQVSIMSAIIATSIGLLTALALRDRFRGWEVLNFLSIAPLLITRVVFGIALLLFFSAIGFPLGFWAIALGLGTLTTAYTTLIFGGRFSDFDRSIEEAAADLGASRFEIFTQIIFPLIKPAIISSLLVSFTASFDELILPLFLRGSGYPVIPTVVFGRLRFTVSPVINALAAVMTFGAIIVMIFVYYFERRSKYT